MDRKTGRERSAVEEMERETCAFSRNSPIVPECQCPAINIDIFFFVIIINGLNLFTILYVCDVCTCVSVRGFGSEGEVCDLCNLLRYFSTALC